MPQPRVVTHVALAGLLLVLALVTLRGLDHHFGNGDEVIYAQNVREMIRTHDYSILHWQEVEVLQRPAAPFALAALGSRLVDGERGLRLTSALASLLTLILVYAIAVGIWRRRDVAAIATLLCAGIPSFHIFSRALLSDAPFVAALTIAIAGTVWAQRDPRGLLVAALGLGIAVASKSLAAAIPGLALAPWLAHAAWHHRARSWPFVAASVLVFLAAATPFYILGTSAHGERFLSEHFGYSLFARARGDLAVGMPGGVFAYLRSLPSSDGLIVAAWIGAASVAGAIVAVRHRDRDLGIVASFALVVFIGLSLVGTRLPHYLLPVFPAAALAAAGLYARATHHQPLMARPLYAALGPIIAATLFLTGIARSEPAAHLLPDPAAPSLGRAAALAVPFGQPVYTLDWYAPAFAYYADRNLKIATRSPSLRAAIDDVDFFRAADVATAIPPAPAGTTLVIAGPATAIRGASWLRVDEILAEVEPLLLVRGRVVGVDSQR